MKGSSVLVVGSGGREHALAWKLAQSPLCDRVFVAPGNPGTAGLPKTKNIPIKAEAIAELTAFAVSEQIDLAVCGPETALCAGMGDAMRAAGVTFFGPSRAAAEIEGSKAYAKKLMARAGVPTAAFGVFEDLARAEDYIDGQAGPVVIKADGLCAGKGVIVTSTAADAKAAVRRLLVDREFGDAGARVVIEERLRGREISMMALCDATRVQLLASAEDHKAIGDGDVGPNTGGMGTYSPSSLVDDALAARIVETIFVPTLRAMDAEGRPFQGLLYGGLMLTPERGPMVIEWNCRFGDPETQSLLVRLDEDLYPWLLGVARGVLPAGPLRWHAGASVCVVLAASGYPGPPRSGDVIRGLEALDDGVLAFHAGTREPAGENAVVSSGGRVLGITARGADLTAARARAYGAIGKGNVFFEGMQYRKDIGARGIQ
ncbi:MAG TPA: phosphoribosylamine--glycine ligase [Polyangia bacterium]|nr:phosphoribosylamine--glycine ligase [Polyangia bacterium]